MEVLQQGLETVFAEEVGGDKAFLDKEPTEDDAGEQSDEEERLLLLGVAMLREAYGTAVHLVVRPEIPVGNLAVEVVGERVGAEAFLPGFVKADEVGDAELGVEVGENEVVEYLDVGADRVGAGDVLDECDLFQNVPGLLPFV